MISCLFLTDKVKECIGHLIIIAASLTKHENIRTLAQYKRHNTYLHLLAEPAYTYCRGDKVLEHIVETLE